MTNTNTTDTPDARAQLRANFRGQASQLAIALNIRDTGAAWHLDPEKEHTDNATLLNGTHERVRLMLDSYDRRITVHGLYGLMPDGRSWYPADRLPRSEPHESPRPSMSIDKTPQQLAADLARRFLPEYRRLLGIYRAQLEAETSAIDRAMHLASVLTLVADGAIVLTRRPAHEPASADVRAEIRGVDGITHGNLQVRPEYVCIEATLTPDRARQLAAWLAGQRTSTSGEDGDSE